VNSVPSVVDLNCRKTTEDTEITERKNKISRLFRGSLGKKCPSIHGAAELKILLKLLTRGAALLL
jgi:hypothetical protein